MAERRLWSDWRGGPVHLAQDPPNERLAWCGARAQFRHLHRDGSVHDVTCPRCVTAIRQQQPRAFGSR